MADWQDWARKLEAADDAEVDDIVDEFAACVLVPQPDQTARQAAIKALVLARSDLSIRSAAAALAYVATDDDSDAVEHLERAFEARRQNVFLAPSLLSILALLGLRNNHARTGAARYLQRLKAVEPRPILVAGIKAIGLLCERENDPKLRQTLYTLVGADDIAVRAEAQQQLALLILGDALQADSHDGLITLLTKARDAFSVAKRIEEFRPDATLLHLLVEAVLVFDELEVDRAAAAKHISGIAARLREIGGPTAEKIFQMDRSPAASQIAEHCAVVASAIEGAAQKVANATRWTNFDKSVVSLAKCYGEIRFRASAMPGYDGAAGTISAVSARVIKPRLGPVLARKVGRESLEEVIRNYETSGANPELLESLNELLNAAMTAQTAGADGLSEESVGTLKIIAEKAGWSLEELITRLKLQIGMNVGDGLMATAELLLSPPGKRGKKMPLPSIGIIVALPEEYDAIRTMIANEKRHRAEGPGGGKEYLLGDIASVRGGVHQVVIAQTMDMGNTSAASRASKMLMDFDGLDHIVMCGIAGGVPHPREPQEHVRLGDIVVSNRKGVIQYDFGKQKGSEFEERPAPRPPSAKLLEAVQMLEQDKLSGQRPWDAHLRNGLAARGLGVPDPATDVILDENGDRMEHPVVSEPSPRVFLGPVASANAVQGDFKTRDRLRDAHKVKAVEMEGYGVADATWEYEKAGYLVVRGICDYCDVRTKGSQTDAWKRYAAFVAAAYVRALIEAMPGTMIAHAVREPTTEALLVTINVHLEFRDERRISRDTLVKEVLESLVSSLIRHASLGELIQKNAQYSLKLKSSSRGEQKLENQLTFGENLDLLGVEWGPTLFVVIELDLPRPLRGQEVS